MVGFSTASKRSKYVTQNNYSVPAEVMDAIVNELTKLPYREVVDVFSLLGDVLAEQQDEPKVEIIQ
jgi:hypothetical protein